MTERLTEHGTAVGGVELLSPARSSFHLYTGGSAAP